MQATIIQKRTLPSIPSASGIEYLNGTFYIISDNTAWLYLLDKNFEETARYPLALKIEPENSVIPKKKKPDFEALTLINTPAGTRLLVLGSGSESPERDKALLLNPDDPAASPDPFLLTPFYDFLRSLPEVAEGFRLNIEAAAATSDRLLLFQRGNISGNNVMLNYKLKEVLQFLQVKNAPLPLPKIRKFRLPVLKNLLSGFSGAAWLPEKEAVLFTASVEDTHNEVDDGISLGSYVGLIDLKNPAATPECTLVMADNQVFTGKIESITPLEVSQTSLRAVAVTDPDGGASEILELELRW